MCARPVNSRLLFLGDDFCLFLIILQYYFTISSTLNPKPVNPRPCTLTLNYTLNPQTPNPKPTALHRDPKLYLEP